MMRERARGVRILTSRLKVASNNGNGRLASPVERSLLQMERETCEEGERGESGPQYISN